LFELDEGFDGMDGAGDRELNYDEVKDELWSLNVQHISDCWSLMALVLFKLVSNKQEFWKLLW
jgi:hypothetical protein